MRRLIGRLLQIASSLRDRAGSVALATTILTPTMLVLLSVSVNFARAELGKQKLQAALDSAALSLARNGGEDLDKNKVVQSFIDANLVNTAIQPDDVTFTAEVEEGLNGRTATISATATVNLFFSDAYGFDDLTFTLGSSTIISLKEIEAALVLDVSGSMYGSKIANLKSAAKSFLDSVLGTEEQVEKTIVSLVPYGGVMHLGPNMEHLMHSSVDTSSWSGCPDFGTEIMNDDLVSDGTLAEMDGNYPSGSSRKYCVQAAPASFLSNDLTALKNSVDGYSADGAATGTDFGTTWGLKALSPDWAGHFPGAPADRPLGYDAPVLKALIIMTDGAITDQYREECTTTWKKKKKKWKKVTKCNSVLKWSAATGRQHFADLCAEAKSKANVVVYTIGFEVSDDTTLDSLKDCASSEEYYFSAEGTELTTVFQTIARQLNDLRITQ